MALIVAWFFHILLDGMWASTEVFLWPFFGFGFPRGPDPYWAGLWGRATSDPWRWVLELIGAGYLAWLWIATGLHDSARRARFFSDGRLPAIREVEAA